MVSVWSSAGQDLDNTRYQPTEVHITVDRARTLRPKWVFTTDGDV